MAHLIRLQYRRARVSYCVGTLFPTQSDKRVWKYQVADPCVAATRLPDFPPASHLWPFTWSVSGKVANPCVAATRLPDFPPPSHLWPLLGVCLGLRVDVRAFSTFRSTRMRPRMRPAETMRRYISLIDDCTELWKIPSHLQHALLLCSSLLHTPVVAIAGSRRTRPFL